MKRPLPGAFIGRAAEQHRLAELWDGSQHGRPGVALVGADAGAGKTRLLQELSGMAGRTGGIVLLGHCVEAAGAGLPYLPMLEALQSLPAAQQPENPLGGAVIAGSDDRTPDAELSDLKAGSFAQTRLFSAIRRLLTSLSESGPVLLVIEDLHWADESTRGLLSFLVRSMRDERLLIALTYRSDDLHRRHPLRPFLAELTRLPQVERLSLAPFTRLEVGGLLDGLADSFVPANTIDRIYRRSEGNPFFAQELFLATRTDSLPIPDSLTDVLLARAHSLPPAARKSLDVVAVAGRHADQELLAAVLAAEPDTLHAGLPVAVEARWLVNTGDCYRFRHALVQEAVYGELLPGERMHWHTLVAEALAEHGPAASAELAFHRIASHDLPGALQALISAAGQAERTAAPAEALRHLEAAIALRQQLGAGADLFELLLGAADAAAGCAEPERAIAFARQAVELADSTCGVAASATARDRLVGYLMQLDECDGARRFAEENLELLGSNSASTLRARALSNLARAIMFTEPIAAGDLLRQTRQLAAEIGSINIAADAMISTAILARRGLLAGDAKTLLAEAIALADAGRNGDSVRIRGMRFLSELLADDGEQNEALALADAGLALATEAGQQTSCYGVDLQIVRGWSLFATGRWDELLADSADATFAPTALLREPAYQAYTVLAGRQAPDAQALLERLRGQSTGLAEVSLELAESALRLDQGDPASAIAIAEQAVRRAEAVDNVWVHQRLLAAVRLAAAHADLAAVARAAGDSSTADKHSTVATLSAAETTGLIPWGSYGLLLRAQLDAEVARAQGMDSAGTWTAVAAAADLAGRLPDVVAARWREARTRLAQGDRGPATVLALQSARDGAAVMGMTGLLDDIHQLGARIGYRFDSAGGQGTMRALPASNLLTAREGQVLHLVANGRSNGQIGAELFISVKTASVHVSRILAKLGADSRTHAVHLARQQRLLE